MREHPENLLEFPDGTNLDYYDRLMEESVAAVIIEDQINRYFGYPCKVTVLPLAHQNLKFFFFY